MHEYGKQIKKDVGARTAMAAMLALEKSALTKKQYVIVLVLKSNRKISTRNQSLPSRISL